VVKDKQLVPAFYQKKLALISITGEQT